MNRAAGIRFGIFALLTGALTVLIGLNIVSWSSEDRIALHATLDDVSGLKVGDAVEISGVPVGDVTGIEVVRGRAAITVEVAADLELPADTAIAVRWLDLLGQREVQLLPGTSDDVLADGDEFSRTRSVVDIGEVVNRLGPLAQSLDPAQLNQLFEAVSIMLDGNRGTVGQLLDDTDVLLATLQERDETFVQLVDDYGTIAGTLAERDAQIQTMIDNLVVLTEAFADSEDVLVAALSETAELAGGLDRLLERNGDELESILGNLATVTDAVVVRLDDVEQGLAQMPATLRALYEATNDGPFLNIALECFAPATPPCPSAGAEPAGLRRVPLDSTDRIQRVLLGVPVGAGALPDAGDTDAGEGTP